MLIKIVNLIKRKEKAKKEKKINGKLEIQVSLDKKYITSYTIERVGAIARKRKEKEREREREEEHK